MDDVVEFIERKFIECGKKVKKVSKVETSGNRMYNVLTSSGEYVFRLCGNDARYRSREEIEAEVGLVNFLHSRDIPVIELLKIDEDFVVSFGGRNGICYKFVDGEIAENPSLEQCYSVGKMLGMIHSATKDYEFCYPRKEWGIEKTREKFCEVESLFLCDEFLCKYDFVERIKVVLDRLRFDGLPRGPIHEDLGMRHVVFVDKDIGSVLDWDRSYTGFYVLDLGQAIRGWCFDGWEKLNLKKFESFLNGYEGERKLSRDEKDALLDAVKFAFVERAIAFAVYAYNVGDDKYKRYAVENIELLERLWFEK
jgi:homoserine kinase type II